MAHFFTPSQKLYNSRQDGFWEFAEAESLASKDLPAFKNEIVTQSQEVSLNNLENPNYLVNNKMVLGFYLAEKQELWLRFSLFTETQETDQGFDDPAIVIFLGEAIIWQQSAKNLQQNWLEQVIHLGEVEAGNHNLYFYAGETGDLQKPTLVKIKNLTVISEGFITYQEHRVGEVLGKSLSLPSNFEKPILNPWVFVVVFLVTLILITFIWKLVNRP